MTILPEQQLSASSASYTNKKPKEKVVDLKAKEPVRPHVKASLEDINWLRSQPPCVQQLWLDCVAVEQFGCQLRKLETHLSSKSFRIAKTALEKRELFRFEAITQVSPSGRSNITGWKIENLHGYYHKAYWEIVPPEREILPSGRKVLPASGEILPSGRKVLPASGEILPSEREILPDVAPETLATTDAAKNQPTLNEYLTTPQPPTKVVEEGSCIPQETEPPLGGAPTNGGIQEEEVSSGSSVVPSYQAQVASDEPKDLGGDTCSAAAPPVATNFPQPGDAVKIDWFDSPYHERIGSVLLIDLERGESEIELKKLGLTVTLPIDKLVPHTGTEESRSSAEREKCLRTIEQLKQRKQLERQQRLNPHIAAQKVLAQRWLDETTTAKESAATGDSVTISQQFHNITDLQH